MNRKKKVESGTIFPVVRCAFTRLESPEKLLPNPRNPNKHPPNQLRIYRKVIEHQGWRKAIVVSRRSGLVVTGHGALETALEAGWKKVPIDAQDFASAEDETAHMLADNGLPQMAEIDEAQVQELLASLGDVDRELTAICEQIKKDVKAPVLTESFQVVVDCDNETEQALIYEQLTREGRTCRVLTL